VYTAAGWSAAAASPAPAAVTARSAHVTTSNLRRDMRSASAPNQGSAAVAGSTRRNPIKPTPTAPLLSNAYTVIAVRNRNSPVHADTDDNCASRRLRFRVTEAHASRYEPRTTRTLTAPPVRQLRCSLVAER
jgi:hypothetical protein